MLLNLLNDYEAEAQKKFLINTVLMRNSQKKMAATYSPAGVQYHRRGRA